MFGISKLETGNVELLQRIELSLPRYFGFLCDQRESDERKDTE